MMMNIMMIIVLMSKMMAMTMLIHDVHHDNHRRYSITMKLSSAAAIVALGDDDIKW